MGKAEVKRPLGRPRRGREGNIKMDLQEVGCGAISWIELAQNRDRWRVLVSEVMKILVPKNMGNFLTSREPVSCSRRAVLLGVNMSKDAIIIFLDNYH